MTSKAFQNVKALSTFKTDSDPGLGGFFPDVTPATRILRARDRLFVGGGAVFTGNFGGTQGGFVPTSTEGANWGPRDSALLVAQDTGLMGITAFVSNTNMNLTGGQPTESIAISGFTINTQATRTTWCGYFDIQHEAGVASYGIEIACKNKSTDKTDTPYLIQGGVYGIWFAAGGDSSYGGASTNPSNVAVRIGGNGGQTWNKGLITYGNGLTRDGNDEATAIELGWKHKVVWRTPLNYTGFAIMCEVEAASSNTIMQVDDNVIRFKGANGVFITEFAHQASAANYFQIINRASGSGPRITAKSSIDTDVYAELMGQGAYGVKLRDGGAATKFELNTTGLGFFGATPVAKPTGVTVDAAGIHAALVSLGLIAA